MKALYIGAGLDLKVIKSIKHIKTFYFCDCQPFSRFGKTVSIGKDGSNSYVRPKFISKLKEEAIKENINLISDESDTNNKLIFSYNEQIITYFINTSIPEDIDIIKDDIKDFDNLIVMGYWPNSIILDYTTKLLCFLGNIITCYTPCDEDIEGTEDVVYKLHIEKSILDRFNNYNLIYNGKILEYDNWSDFIKTNKDMKLTVLRDLYKSRDIK